MCICTGTKILEQTGCLCGVRSGQGEPAAGSGRAHWVGGDGCVLASLVWNTFRGRPRPLIVDRRGAVPGASVWSEARAWCAAFRSLGVGRGDRIALALPGGRTHAAVTIAGWWEGLTVCVCDPGGDHDGLLDELDARVAIGARRGPGRVGVDCNGEPRVCGSVRDALMECSGGIALMLRTSGTVGAGGRWIALSEGNLGAHLSSHGSALTTTPDELVLSHLPWHHAFGLLVDVWPALLRGGVVMVDREYGRDPGAVVDVVRGAVGARVRVSASMVPLQARRLLEVPGGLSALRSLGGGVIGGAPVGESLAEALRGTSLRAGYGLTEASPGVCLGDPGVWVPGLLGRPLGCEVELDGGEVVVRGENVCAGVWEPGVGLLRRREGEALRTGDLAERTPAGLVYRGRVDHRFKLGNGREVDVPALEAALGGLVGADGVAVITRAGEVGIDVALIGGLCVPDRGALARAIGDSARLVRHVAAFADGPGVRTAKGEPNRRAVAELHERAAAARRSA